MNNADLTTRRTLESCKDKFRKLKMETKKAVTSRRLALGRTGGGPPPPPLHATFEQIASVVPQEALLGIEEGLDTRHDIITSLYCPEIS